MTTSAVVFTDNQTSHDAGRELGEQIIIELGELTPHVVIVFASSNHDYPVLLDAIKTSCNTEILVGSSSAGEFTSDRAGTHSICAVAIHSTTLKFSACLAEGIKGSREDVAQKLYTSLSGANDVKYRYHSAMIFADALSGYTDELIDLLTEKTAGTYQFFGGGAGDNANFNQTHVFCNEEHATDAAVILEILSNKPVGIGVSHGWKPTGQKMRVTDVDGMRLISINAMPAVEAFTEHANNIRQPFDTENPIPFFLHNVLGIESFDGYKLRVPLSVEADGSIMLASDIPPGAYISFMSSNAELTKDAALQATHAALEQLKGNKPNVALFFDCVATRLRMGAEFDFELEKVRKALPSINYAGCNTYGQIARVDGQFSGFHNCTAVVCVIPE